jgi:phage FluMu protein Com
MKVRCPQCGQVLNAPDEAAGRKVRCQACRTVFFLSKPDDSETQPVSSPAWEAARLELTEAPPRERAVCPICRASMDTAVSICAMCGFNRRTGKTSVKHLHKLEEESAADEREEEKVAFPLLVLQFLGELLPGLFRPGLLIGAIILSIIAFAILGLALFIIGLGGLISGMAIGGTGLVLYGQALGILLYGEWAFLPECLAECDSRRWLLFLVLLFAPFAAAYLLIRQHLPI